MEHVEARVRSFILGEFLPGADASELTDATELITTGILDSLATLKLVAYLEETFGIRVEAHEASVDHLNTVAQIADLVKAKAA